MADNRSERVDVPHTFDRKGTVRASFRFFRYHKRHVEHDRDAMTDHNRIVKHELLRSKCGSFEVRFPNGRESRYFHWDDFPSRRLRPEILSREQALEQAREFARAERDKSG